MRRRILSVGAAAAVLMAAACGGGGDQGGGNGSGELTTINVGVIPITDIAPLHLGIEQGFFEKRGLDVQTQNAQGGAAIVPNVVSGQAQFGFSNVVSLMLARDRGLPLRIVANGNNSTGQQGEDFSAVMVSPDSSIQDATDLQGKNVAVNTLQNIGPVSINEAIRQAGGDPSQNPVNYTEMALPDMLPALDQGNIDAAWLVEPFVTMASQQQDAQAVLWNMAALGDNTMIAAYFTTRQYAEQNPEVVTAFREGMAESLEYAQNNLDEVRDVIPGYTELDPELVQELMLPQWQNEINRESLQQWADLTLNEGYIDSPVDVNQLLMQ